MRRHGDTFMTGREHGRGGTMLVAPCDAVVVAMASLPGCTASAGRPSTHGRSADVGKPQKRVERERL